jgi:predicted CXXCH cytochrome family protein
LLTEPVTSAEAGVGQETQADGGGRRGRVLIALLILLLLLLCVLATVADVFIGRTPQQRQFISRNLECLQCHTEFIPDLSKTSVHNPFLLKDCGTCHTKHGTEVTERRVTGVSQTWQRLKTLVEWLPIRLACRAFPGAGSSSAGSGEVATSTVRVKGNVSNLVMPEKDLCWTCHGNLGPLKGMAYQHAPFEAGYCTNCHDPHASDNKALLKQNEQDLCKTCHPMGSELSRAQTHPPAAGWFCTNCHNPHASNWKGILVTRQRDLCFQCHPTVAPLSLKAVQHNPFLYDNCSGCHEPHGSNTRPLLIAAQPALCYRCHPTIANDFQKPSHHPVGTVKLNCSDCHNPHAADFGFLLDARDNSFCYECHRSANGSASAIGATYQQSAHVGQLCIRCHTPHGSVFAPLLRNSNPELCLECHTWYDNTHIHPVSGRFYDSHAKKRLTCTSTCHNPHGTQYPRMLKYPYRKDGLCLQCHPGVGISF